MKVSEKIMEIARKRRHETEGINKNQEDVEFCLRNRTCPKCGSIIRFVFQPEDGYYHYVCIHCEFNCIA